MAKFSLDAIEGWMQEKKVKETEENRVEKNLLTSCLPSLKVNENSIDLLWQWKLTHWSRWLERFFNLGAGG